MIQVAAGGVKHQSAPKKQVATITINCMKRLFHFDPAHIKQSNDSLFRFAHTQVMIYFYGEIVLEIYMT